MLSSFDLLLVVTSVAVMLWGFLGRYRMWRQGKPEGVSSSEKTEKIGKNL